MNGEKLAVGLHGWSDEVEKRVLWRPQMTGLLNQRGYEVTNAEISAPDDLDIDLWETTVDGLIIPRATSARSLIVFSHSNSGSFILNSAAKLEEGKIDLAVLVAPYLELKSSDLEEKNPVRYQSAVRMHRFASSIDLAKAGKNIRKTVLLYCEGENDAYINIEHNIALITQGMQSDVDVVRVPHARHFIARNIRPLPEILERYLGPVM